LPDLLPNPPAGSALKQISAPAIILPPPPRMLPPVVKEAGKRVGKTVEPAAVSRKRKRAGEK
jgi:hypothetical protein